MTLLFCFCLCVCFVSSVYFLLILVKIIGGFQQPQWTYLDLQSNDAGRKCWLGTFLMEKMVIQTWSMSEKCTAVVLPFFFQLKYCILDLLLALLLTCRLFGLLCGWSATYITGAKKANFHIMWTQSCATDLICFKPVVGTFRCLTTCLSVSGR